MVGKIKHVRQKLHQEAVRLHTQPGPGPGPGREAGAGAGAGRHVSFQLEEEKPHRSTQREPTANTTDTAPQKAPPPAPPPISFPSRIFAGTKISPKSLVQTLKFEEPPEAPKPPTTTTNATATKTGEQDKKIRSKKEKMKERRERWLSKISSIKQLKEAQAARAQRQATPVVGDMRVLAEALPELSELLAPPPGAAAGHAPAARRKSRKSRVPVKRPEPTDFSQMKQSQKRKLLEAESGRFSEAVQTLSGRKNPLGHIGEQLRKRMRQEEEQGHS